MYNQSMRLPAFLFFLCFLSLPALAAEAISGDALRLEDGRVVRLLGVKAPGNMAGGQTTALLQSLIRDQKLLLEGGTPDRYGRIAADVYVQRAGGGKTWLQGELLRQGAAFVYPPTGDEPHLGALLKSEREARQARRGIWGGTDYADLSADQPAAMGYGHFAFVGGKVVRAARVKNMVYLNFGEDWRTSFTITIAVHDLHLFKKAKIDPLDYEGKKVRVRGWIKQSGNRPVIAVTHPAQIEMLGAAAAKP